LFPARREGEHPVVLVYLVYKTGHLLRNAKTSTRGTIRIIEEVRKKE